MRGRQPDVQRHDAGLNAEAEEEEQKRRVPTARGHLAAERAEAVEVVTARRLEEQQETQNEAAGADVRHHEVKHAGVAGLGLLVLEADQEVSDHRHDFPGDEEEKRIVRNEHQSRHQQKGIIERAEQADVFPPVKAPGIAEGIDRQRQCQQRHNEDEKGGQGVEPDRKLQIRDCRPEKMPAGVERRDVTRQQNERGAYTAERGQGGGAEGAQVCEFLASPTTHSRQTPAGIATEGQRQQELGELLHGSVKSEPSSTREAARKSLSVRPWFHFGKSAALSEAADFAEPGTATEDLSGTDADDFLARISRARARAASMWAQTFSRPRRSRKPARSMAKRGW